MWASLRAAALDAWAVVAPIDCAGCGAPDRGLCDGCRAELAVWHAFDYGGTARGILLAFKDMGRTDVAPALAAVLRRLVRAAAATAPPAARGRVELVAIPSTRAAYRRRGYAQLRLLLARAGYREGRLLRIAKQTQDQSQLNTTDRFTNREDSLTVRGTGTGRFALIVDDIVTTGATVLAADQALRNAGVEVLGVVALARTRRRFPRWESRAK
ncbi:MAG: ComF family protein [Microbacteriaceae bacterium]|nr:ComF family protein [Microbacteriaceae bacterium]